MNQHQKGKDERATKDEVISSLRAIKEDNSAKAARILLVDDEQDIAIIIKKGLQQFGFKINAFSNPVQALSEFEAGSYDIALLDVRMPQMNGFELCRELKERDSNLTVYFMTAFEIYETEFKNMFPSYDVQYFIRKPIKMSKLAEQLTKVAISRRDKLV